MNIAQPIESNPLASALVEANPLLEDSMRHLLMKPEELSHYHLDRPAPREARRTIAMLVESGIPEDEARRRLEGHPELRHELAAERAQSPHDGAEGS